MDKTKLKSQVNNLLESEQIKGFTSVDVDQILESLTKLKAPDLSDVKNAVLSKFSGAKRALLEAVDFSDSNYWIKQILDNLNK